MTESAKRHKAAARLIHEVAAEAQEGKMPDLNFMEWIGFAVMCLGLLFLFIHGVKETDGWLLIIFPAAAVVWLGCQFAYLWYSPNFWPIVIWSTAAIAVIAALCWIGYEWPKVAIAIVVVIAVGGLIALGFFSNPPTSIGDAR